MENTKHVPMISDVATRNMLVMKLRACTSPLCVHQFSKNGLNPSAAGLVASDPKPLFVNYEPVSREELQSFVPVRSLFLRVKQFIKERSALYKNARRSYLQRKKKKYLSFANAYRRKSK